MFESLRKLFSFGTLLDFSNDLAYRQSLLETKYNSIIRQVLFGTALYMLFFVVDAFLLPEKILFFFTWRVLLMGLTSFIGFQLIKKKVAIKNPNEVELILIGAFFFGQVGHIIIAWMHTETIVYYVITTSILFIWGNSFLMIKFSNKVLFALCNLLVLLVILLTLNINTPATIIFSIFSLSFLIILSLLATYGLEMEARKNYIKMKVLTKQSNDFREIEQYTAHELKTSVRVINGLSHLILKNEGDNLSPKSAEHLQIIKKQILALNKTIDDVRSMAAANELTGQLNPNLNVNRDDSEHDVEPIVGPAVSKKLETGKGQS